MRKVFFFKLIIWHNFTKMVYRKLSIDTRGVFFFIFTPGVVQVLTKLMREYLLQGKSELLHGLIIDFILLKRYLYLR